MNVFTDFLYTCTTKSHEIPRKYYLIFNLRFFNVPVFPWYRLWNLQVIILNVCIINRYWPVENFEWRAQSPHVLNSVAYFLEILHKTTTRDILDQQKAKNRGFCSFVLKKMLVRRATVWPQSGLTLACQMVPFRPATVDQNLAGLWPAGTRASSYEG